MMVAWMIFRYLANIVQTLFHPNTSHLAMRCCSTSSLVETQFILDSCLNIDHSVSNFLTFLLGWRPRSLNFKDPRGIPVLAPKFGAGTGRGQQFGRGDFQGLSPISPRSSGRGGDSICSPRRGRGGAGRGFDQTFGDEG